jgi:hypothetical protein
MCAEAGRGQPAGLLSAVAVAARPTILLTPQRQCSLRHAHTYADDHEGRNAVRPRRGG